MSEKLAYLGWGIIGTAKGRQAVGDGVDKTLGLARNFDLAQELGGCLPEPKQDPHFSEVLYCLSLQSVGKHNVLGLAEYRPAYEQGQSRAGSYFGSFIESVSFSFGENSLSTLFAALFKLSQFQYQHFIDPNTRSYKESIQGKTIQAPESDLLQIAEQIQPLTANLLSQTVVEDSLFVQCSAGKIVDTLKTLLNEQLYYRFKHIYFTESDYIATQMQGRKMAKLHFSYLEAGKFFTDSYRKEILFLHYKNRQYYTELKKVEETLTTERANQAQQVAVQVQQKTAEVQVQLQQQVEEYHQQAAHYKKQAEDAMQSVASIRQDAVLGDQVRNLVKETLGSADPQSALFGGNEVVTNAQLASQLSEISGDLKTLAMRSSSQTGKTGYSQSDELPVESSPPRKEPLNLILAILSGLLLTILLGIGVYSFFSEEPQKADPKVEQQLKETQVKLKSVEDELKARKDELKELREQPQSSEVNEITIIEDFVVELCKENPTDSRNLDMPNVYKEKLSEGKLCRSSK